MKISIKIKQRCLVCKDKLSVGEEICIQKDNTVIHKKCIPRLKEIVEKHVRYI